MPDHARAGDEPTLYDVILSAIRPHRGDIIDNPEAIAEDVLTSLRAARWWEHRAELGEPECNHTYWTSMPNGTTWCRTCGVETTEMEAMGG